MAALLDKDDVLAAFEELGRRAREAGRIVEVSVYDGTALLLTYDWRQATRDVHAVFEADKSFVYRIAADIADSRGWDRNWLNDGVTGFLSHADATAPAKALLRTFPSEDEPGLRVMLATPRYLFAMKCLAMRLDGPDGRSDVEDIRQLARELDVTSAADALELVAAFYPLSRISVKTQFGLEEILDGAGGVASESTP